MNKIKKCIIPAAGFGTRFLPATKSIPKEMFPIVDKPVIQYLVEEAMSIGCTDIMIITGKNKRSIEDHFDSHFELEAKLKKDNKINDLNEIKKINKMVNISYIRQPYPRGDGEAILRAKTFIGNDPFLVLFGDDLIDGKETASKQLLKVYNNKNTSVIATVEVKDEEVSNYGIIESSEYGNDFLVEKFLEKPKSIETKSRNGVVGKYILNKNIFSYLEKISKKNITGEIRLADAFELMLKKEKIYGVKIEGERFDTGSKIGFLKAIINYSLKNDKIKSDLLEYIKKII